MKEELKRIIEEYLETLKETHAVYGEDGSFDKMKELQHIPTFTSFIDYLGVEYRKDNFN